MLEVLAQDKKRTTKSVKKGPGRKPKNRGKVESDDDDDDDRYSEDIQSDTDMGNPREETPAPVRRPKPRRQTPAPTAVNLETDVRFKQMMDTIAEVQKSFNDAMAKIPMASGAGIKDTTTHDDAHLDKVRKDAEDAAMRCAEHNFKMDQAATAIN